jgi:hypothetical protein
MQTPTVDQVLTNLNAYQTWLRETCGLQENTARYYRGCVERLTEEPFTPEELQKRLHKWSVNYSTAWEKRHGFLSFWAQRNTVQEAAEVPTPTPGKPFIDAYTLSMSGDPSSPNDTLDIRLSVAKNSDLAKALATGTCPPFDIVPVPVTPASKLYTEEELQLALAEDRAKEGRAGRDASRNVLKEIIGHLLGGKTLNEVNNLTGIAHAGVNDLRETILTLLATQAAHMNGLNWVYEAVLGHVPAETLSGGKKADEILAALPKRDTMQDLLSTGTTPKVTLLDMEQFAGLTVNLLAEEFGVLGADVMGDGEYQTAEAFVKAMVAKIHAIRVQRGQEILQNNLGHVLRVAFNVEPLASATPEALHAQIQDKASSLTRSLQQKDARAMMLLVEVSKKVLGVTPPESATTEGIISSLTSHTKLLEDSVQKLTAHTRELESSADFVHQTTGRHLLNTIAQEINRWLETESMQPFAWASKPKEKEELSDLTATLINSLIHVMAQLKALPTSEEAVPKIEADLLTEALAARYMERRVVNESAVDDLLLSL